MPQQVSRLLIMFAIFVGIFIIARVLFVPKSFGEYGHYRGDAIREIAAREVKYVDKQTCVKCHEVISDTLTTDSHSPINCQTCHGPGYKHNQYHEEHHEYAVTRDTSGAIISHTPDEFRLVHVDSRQFCLKCHLQNAARPEKIIMQIDTTDHFNVNKKCVKCHNPHTPNS